MIPKMRRAAGGTHSNRFVGCVAERFQVALGALGFAGGTDAAPMPDQLVGKLNPFVPRDDGDQVLLDLFGVIVARQVQALREPKHVRIHDDAAGDPVGRTQNDVGRFSRHARERE